ncbi:Mov34/MPN/PAD-1 family protein [Cellvibrio sp. ARAG 10.3]|uniref:Mov34/MPN/PAD-1 family protein n=1 Tax=Cellvibrio sp. ARAG 10.3 TaxID=3451358 RepID=UPI003F47F517
MSSLQLISDNFIQDIFIESQVVEYLIRNRQRHAWCSEAGGQLFGVISAQTLTIKCASGPYPKDDRGPRHYRSHPQSAQRELVRQNKLGNVYLGEWHTHAEKKPKASQDDADAMKKILENSKLATNGLLLIIVGQDLSCNAISIFSYMNHDLIKWRHYESLNL